ncbi:hypothetical protein TNCV_2570501 [Trichonephila clavipes]|nr:hypothetical protein TNCV_2570501 [Trichonephila clavipes]
MFRSGDQSEARPPVLKSPRKLGTHLSTHCKHQGTMERSLKIYHCLYKQCSTNSEKFEDSYSLDEDDLIEFMTVCDNKEIDNDEVEGEVQLFRYSTTFGTVILQERVNG